MHGRIGGEQGTALVTLAGAVFMAPFFLFSATAGQIADKFEKTRLIRIVKAAEIVGNSLKISTPILTQLQ